MKTVDYLNDRISELRSEAVTVLPLQLKQIKKEHRFLLDCKLYVESGVSEAYLLDQIRIIENKIIKIYENYSNWYHNQTHSDLQNMVDPVEIYYDEMGVPRLREQIKALRFILE